MSEGISKMYKSYNEKHRSNVHLIAGIKNEIYVEICILELQTSADLPRVECFPPLQDPSSECSLATSSMLVGCLWMLPCSFVSIKKVVQLQKRQETKRNIRKSKVVVHAIEIIDKVSKYVGECHLWHRMNVSRYEKRTWSEEIEFLLHIFDGLSIKIPWCKNYDRYHIRESTWQKIASATHWIRSFHKFHFETEMNDVNLLGHCLPIQVVSLQPMQSWVGPHIWRCGSSRRSTGHVIRTVLTTDTDYNHKYRAIHHQSFGHRFSWQASTYCCILPKIYLLLSLHKSFRICFACSVLLRSSFLVR